MYILSDIESLEKFFGQRTKLEALNFVLTMLGKGITEMKGEVV